MVSLTFKSLISKSPAGEGLWAMAGVRQQGAVSPQRENPNASEEPVGLLFEGTGVR